MPARVDPPPLPHLSIGLPNFSPGDPGGWDHLLERARMLDRAGFDRLAVSDHVAFGEDLDAYARPELGGTAGGRQPTGPDGQWLEPLTTLAAICSVTERVRLATSILLAALRRPVVLAKTAATLDVLSKGRLDLGVGVGWQREEYDAAGLAFEERGALLDHSLEVCQAIWRDERASLHGHGSEVDGIHSMPKPRQDHGVPIWVSGTVNRRVARRLARYGSGWIPWGDAIADVRNAIRQMRDLVAAEGGDPEGLGVVGMLPTVRDSGGAPDIEATVAAAPALVEAGVTDVRTSMSLRGDPSAAEDTAAGLVGAFRAEVGRAPSG